MAGLKRFRFVVEEYEVDIYVMGDDAETIHVLNEARQRGRYSLGGPYSVDIHGPHTSPGEHHLHFFNKNKQMFALNRGNTGHDGYHDFRIPNKVYRAATELFPDWKINQVIESVDTTSVQLDANMRLFMEWFS